jgi:tryptophan synthase alpha chain
MRLAELLQDARGFIYHVTLTGTTGAASATAADVEAAITRLRRHSRLPVAAGFGIRSAAQVRELAGKAELIVVGSRLVEVLAHNGVEAALEEVRALAAACHPQP